MGPAHTKKLLIIFLQFTFNWVLCILLAKLGNPTPRPREASTLCHLSLLAGALSSVPEGSQAGEQWTELKSRCQACSFLLRKEVTVVLNAQFPDCVR